jgi:L-lactate dehydrogenase
MELELLLADVIIDNYCMLCNNKSDCDHKRILDEILPRKKLAYKIIEKKVNIVLTDRACSCMNSQAVLQNENAVLPVSVLIQDFCGVNDVYLSLPTVINADGVRQVQKIEFNEIEKKSFVESAAVLKQLLKEFGF